MSCDYFVSSILVTDEHVMRLQMAFVFIKSENCDLSLFYNKVFQAINLRLYLHVFDFIFVL